MTDETFIFRDERRWMGLRRKPQPDLSPSSICWIVAYDECVAVLRSEAFGSDIQSGLFTSRIGDRELRNQRKINSVLFMDGEQHQRTRRRIIQALPSIEDIDDEIQQCCAETMEALDVNVGVDLVEEFARPIASEMTCRIIGVPLEWKSDISAVLDRVTPGVGQDASEETIYDGRLASLQLMRIIQRSYTQRSGPDGARKSALDVLADLERTNDITKAQLWTNGALLAHAAYENSVNLLSFGALILAQSPEIRRSVGASGRDTSRLLEEIIRISSPAQAVVRVAKRGCTIGRHEISSGDVVAVVLSAANRDPALFDVENSVSSAPRMVRHIAFGSGAHACPGAAIARAEAISALVALCSALGERTFELEVKWKPGIMMRGPISLFARSKTI